MTFENLVDAAAERLNLTSDEALARIGRHINGYYKRVTAAIGLDTSRRATVQATATIGVRTLTFSGVEKIISVQDRSTGSIKVLAECTVEEIDENSVGTGQPTTYAIRRMGAGSVTIYLNCNPQTEFTLYAEGLERAETLNGTLEPAFPESFHDALVEGAVYEELKKQEKLALAKETLATYERRLADLRMFIAKSAMQDIYQGKRSNGWNVGASGGSSSGSSTGSSSYSQTGLITFDRSSAGDVAPFAVDSDADAVVTNLDADKLDGSHGSFYQDASNLNSGTIPLGRISGITNTQVSASAAIAYSKLNLAASIVNADVSNSAAIGWSKVSKSGSVLADIADVATGSWTPIFVGSGGSSGQAYSFQNGRYTKVGKQVSIQGQIVISTVGTLTTSVEINGLPFASASGGVNSAVHIGYFDTLSTSVVWLSGFIPVNSSAIRLFKLTAAGTQAAALVQADLAAGTNIVFSATYETA